MLHTLFVTPHHPKQRPAKERISVSNFVATINEQVVGILNERMFEKGIMRIWPIGGGARIHDKDMLEHLGAQECDMYDARCIIDRASRKALLNALLLPNPQLVETDIRRELFEELANVVYEESERDLYPLLSSSRKLDPIISPENLEMWLLHTSYAGTLSYRRPSQHHESMMTNYIWYLHDVFVTNKVFNELIALDHVIIITPEIISAGHSNMRPILPSIQAIYKHVQSPHSI